LTTRHELQPTPSRARRCGGCGCHPILPGSRSSRAHRRHPPAAALSSADGPNVTTFDARITTRVRRSAARAARTAFPAASSKATNPTTQDVFHRRVPTRPPALARRRPRTRTRHRSRDFAAPARLPTLFRSALPKEEELDPAASGRSSRSGAHGHTPLVDFCNRKDPQARPTDLRNPAIESGRAAFAELPISLRAPRGELDDRVNGRRSTAREPRIHGSGAVFRVNGLAPRPPRPLPPRLLVRGASPQPDRLSDTSRCSIRLRRGWSRRDTDRIGRRASKISSTRPLCVRARQGRAASHIPSRKEDVFRRTRGAFLRRTHPSGWCPFPQLVTNLWSGARAFSIIAPYRARTVQRGCGDSASPPE